MEKNKEEFKIWYAISFALQLGFLIVFPISGFIVLGLWLDQILDSLPWLLILGVIIGLLVTFYEVYHTLTPLIKDNKHD